MKMKIKRTFILAVLLMAVAMRISSTERNLLEKTSTEEQLKANLVMNQKWVPYPAYDDRSGWDKFLGNDKESYIKIGEKYLGYNWTVVKATDYLEYERSGSRDAMQNPNNNNSRAFTSLLMAELAEGKGRFVDDIINGVMYFCETTSWAESAHLAAYQKTRRALPDYREDILELNQGEKSQMLAWTYYFLHNEFDKVDPMISSRLRYELQKRELTPYLQRTDFWWMAFRPEAKDFVNNWNPWCNSNALICFMLLENDKDVLAQAVYKTMTSVDKYINYVKPDGACEEGPSYWGHAAGKLYNYLTSLSMITGGKINIFGDRQIRNMGEYISNSYIGDGWVVNFADASARNDWNSSIIYRYGVAVNSDYMKSMAAQRYKRHAGNSVNSVEINQSLDISDVLEAYRYLPMLKQETTEYTVPSFVWYPQTEFCYMRDKGSFFAAKGGYNDESHNHNDAGSFIFYVNNTPIMIDAGVGAYTRQTFSADRYKIWTMQSDYHNLPMINGFSQKNGLEYKATNTKANEKQDIFYTDISKAYPEEAAVSKWIRSYKLQKGNLLISDEFALDEAKAANRINFLTWGDVDVSHKGVVNITVNGVGAQLKYDSNQFDASIETINLTDARLSNVWGDKIYRVSLTAKKLVKSGIYKYQICCKR